MSAIFRVEKVRSGQPRGVPQLQYTQTVLLDFGGLTWPQVSVGTLRKVT
jgi:hypothetical protein